MNCRQKILLSTDVSDARVGAVNEQELKSQHKPIGFFSAKFLLAQTRYSNFSRELLAVYLAIKHFHHLFEGSDFTIYTNHKPLTIAMNTNSVKNTS